MRALFQLVSELQAPATSPLSCDAIALLQLGFRLKICSGEQRRACSSVRQSTAATCCNCAISAAGGTKKQNKIDSMVKIYGSRKKIKLFFWSQRCSKSWLVVRPCVRITPPCAGVCCQQERWTGKDLPCLAVTKRLACISF